jgi:hypothetical protein
VCAHARPALGWEARRRLWTGMAGPLRPSGAAALPSKAPARAVGVTALPTGLLLLLLLLSIAARGSIVREEGSLSRLGVLPQRDGALDDLATSSQLFYVLPLTRTLRSAFRAGEVSAIGALHRGWALLGPHLKWDVCLSVRVLLVPSWLGRVPSFGAIAAAALTWEDAVDLPCMRGWSGERPIQLQLPKDSPHARVVHLRIRVKASCGQGGMMACSEERMVACSEGQLAPCGEGGTPRGVMACGRLDELCTELTLQLAASQHPQLFQPSRVLEQLGFDGSVPEQPIALLNRPASEWAALLGGVYSAAMARATLARSIRVSRDASLRERGVLLRPVSVEESSPSLVLPDILAAFPTTAELAQLVSQTKRAMVDPLERASMDVVWTSASRGCRGPGHAVTLFSDSYVVGVATLAWTVFRHHPQRGLVVLLPSAEAPTRRVEDAHMRELSLPGSGEDSVAWASTQATLSPLKPSSFLLLARAHRSIVRGGGAGLRVFLVRPIDAPGCLTLPRIGSLVWTKLYAWLLTDYCGLMLHDADQVLLRPLTHGFTLLESACRPSCNNGHCSCASGRTKVAFSSIVVPDWTLQVQVGGTLLVPSPVVFRDLVQFLHLHEELVLCETTMLPLAFDNADVLVLPHDFLCIAEMLDLHYGPSGGVTRVAVGAKDAITLTWRSWLPFPLTTASEWEEWMTGGEGTSFLRHGERLHWDSELSSCAVLDFQSCNQGFKPWHEGFPSHERDKYCRWASYPGDSYWNATLAWRSLFEEMALEASE